jgi:predicted small metal-binding protein
MNMDRIPGKKDFQPKPLDMVKVRGLLQSKQKEIFSADPEAGNGDYGSAVVVSLMGKGAMSSAKIMEELLVDYNETHGEEVSEEVKDRVKTTIENLVKSNVVVEKDGVLELNLE